MVMRIGPRGLARMRGAPVSALPGGYYALLREHRLAQPLPSQLSSIPWALGRVRSICTK